MIISIDIGTSYSSICYRNEQGEAQPIDIATGGGVGDKYSLPTAVCVENSGNVLVGQAAMAARKITPGNFCMEFKRDLGSSIPMLLGDKQFLPQDLYTQLLLHMKKCCRNISDESFEQISITYPVAYSEKKRKLIVSAANKAGLFDVQLVDEPSAAAMAYYAKGLLKEGETVLIYDFGGGTFDVSVVRYAQGAFQVLKTGGLEHCGGSDIDYLIFEDMMAKSYEILGEEVMGMLTKNTLHQQKFQTQLSEEAIKGKCQLSTATTFTTYLAAGFDGFSYTMSRDTLNYKIASLIDHSIQECHRVLKLAGLTVTDLSAVFLVGGSSRIPLVQEMVQTFAKNAPVRSAVDLELAVAQGALCQITTAPLKDPEEWYQEGEDYYNGANGKNIDFSKAVLCYQKAAEQAHCKAQFNLARMYSKGEGCVQNDSEAVRWYTLAATVGNYPAAQNNLGVLSLIGRGVPKDDTMAAQWFEKAAEQEHAVAQYILAKMLEQGRGVAKNQKRALYFYEKAAEQGVEEAKIWCTKIATQEDAGAKIKQNKLGAGQTAYEETNRNRKITVTLKRKGFVGFGSAMKICINQEDSHALTSISMSEYCVRLDSGKHEFVVYMATYKLANIRLVVYIQHNVEIVFTYVSETCGRKSYIKATVNGGSILSEEYNVML